MQDTKKNKLASRAKRKYKNSPLLAGLLDLKSKNNKAYTRSFFCSNVLKVDLDRKVKGRYCKNRCCIVCNTIRAQVRFIKYSPYLTGRMQFTTLTVPNCTIEEYPTVMRKIKKSFHQIRNTIKKRGNSIIGVSNIEETINLKDGSIHPHIHIIHSPVKTHIIGHSQRPYLPKSEEKNKNIERVGEYKIGTRQEVYYGNEITSLHLKNNTSALVYLQKVLPIQDNMNLQEVFKYTTKPFQFCKKTKQQTIAEYEILIQENFKKYVHIYDQLYTLKKGLRFFETFNLKTLQLTEVQELAEMAKISVQETEKPEGYYVWKIHDWISSEDGETLSDFMPSKTEIKKHELLNSSAKKEVKKQTKKIDLVCPDQVKKAS